MGEPYYYTTMHRAPLAVHPSEVKLVAEECLAVSACVHTPVMCSAFLVRTVSSSLLPSRRGDLDGLRGDLEGRRGGDREDLDLLLGERDMGLPLPRLGE